RTSRRTDAGIEWRSRSPPLVPACESALYELAEHLFRIDRDEHTFAAGQDFALFIEDLRRVYVLTAVHADFPAFDAKRLFQRDGPQILHRHLFGHSHHIAQLVGLTHGVVEDGSDDAAMAMAGRSGITLGKIEVADKGAPLFIEREFEMHSFGIVGPASEAVVLRWIHVA